MLEVDHEPEDAVSVGMYEPGASANTAGTRWLGEGLCPAVDVFLLMVG